MPFVAILKAAEFAIKAAQIVKSGVEAGRDMSEYWKAARAKLDKMEAEKRGPTDAEWAELDAQVDANHAEIQKP